MTKEDCKDSSLGSVVQPQQDARRAIESDVQPAAIIAILNAELLRWREGVEFMRANNLNNAWELGAVKAIEMAIKRIQREARS